MSRFNKCVDETGKCLRECNEDIVQKLCDLMAQRDEMVELIERQYEEKKKIETDLEKLTYKLCLINKSLFQRLKTKSQYDKTIDDIEKHYKKLTENSNILRDMLEQDHFNLEEMMNKKIGTDPDDEGGVKVLYAKKWVETVEFGPNKCTCDNMPSKDTAPRAIKSEPTKDDSAMNGCDEQTKSNVPNDDRRVSAGETKKEHPDVQKTVKVDSILQYEDNTMQFEEDTISEEELREEEMQQVRRYTPPPILGAQKPPPFPNLPSRRVKEKQPLHSSIDSEGSELLSISAEDSQEKIQNVKTPRRVSETATLSSMRSARRKSDVSSASGRKRATSFQLDPLSDSSMLLRVPQESVESPPPTLPPSIFPLPLPSRLSNARKKSSVSDEPIRSDHNNHPEIAAPIHTALSTDTEKPSIDILPPMNNSNRSSYARTSNDSNKKETALDMDPEAYAEAVERERNSRAESNRTSTMLKVFQKQFEAKKPKEATIELPEEHSK